MSENWLAVLERTYARSARPELLHLLPDNDNDDGNGPDVRRHAARGPARTGRPAWQSPYGPPPHRAHRGRWAPVAVAARPRPVLRRGHLCGRCD
ncbi:hypothetical protein [Streptomyces sp. NBC_00096]|uniref:hypothetical protein n=1 Tax=Streptomyces sp. NBC_00096 TaxID=2975650 RepID=UPI003243E114